MLTLKVMCIHLAYLDVCDIRCTYVKNGSLRNYEQVPKESLLSFFLCYLICLCFSVYFPFICPLNELKYLCVLLTTYFIHTVNFPTKTFVHCYLLALE
jgi:hypothetical protein